MPKTYDAMVIGSTFAEGPASSMSYTVRVFMEAGQTREFSNVTPVGPRPTLYDVVAPAVGTRYTAFLDDRSVWRHQFVELPATTECG